MRNNTIIKQGKTKKGEWKDNDAGGGAIYVRVDTTSFNFKKTPHYITSIEGNKHHWDVSGVNSIYEVSETGFTVFIKWIGHGRETLTKEVACKHGWYIRWTAILTE